MKKFEYYVSNPNSFSAQINDNQAATLTDSTPINNELDFIIGNEAVGSWEDAFNGCLVSFRISNPALYTESFTPPAYSLTVTEDTKFFLDGFIEETYLMDYGSDNISSTYSSTSFRYSVPNG